MDKRIPAEEGSITTIRCRVSGHPEPRVLWYRDRKLREPIARGPDFDLNMKPNKEVSKFYNLTTCILQSWKTPMGVLPENLINWFGI